MIKIKEQNFNRFQFEDAIYSNMDDDYDYFVAPSFIIM